MRQNSIACGVEWSSYDTKGTSSQDNKFTMKDKMHDLIISYSKLYSFPICFSNKRAMFVIVNTESHPSATGKEVQEMTCKNSILLILVRISCFIFVRIIFFISFNLKQSQNKRFFNYTEYHTLTYNTFVKGVLTAMF